MTVIVAPQSKVEDVIALHRPSHVLSLVSPGMTELRLATIARERHLVLRFHDVAAVTEGFVAPDLHIIQSILDFGDQCGGGELLVHCYAGISRSTAAAYILACRRAGAGNEQCLAQKLRVLSPTATPNPLMIAIADKLLQREGRMIDAIAAIGRGQEAAEGCCFEFQP